MKIIGPDGGMAVSEHDVLELLSQYSFKSLMSTLLDTFKLNTRPMKEDEVPIYLRTVSACETAMDLVIHNRIRHKAWALEQKQFHTVLAAGERLDNYINYDYPDQLADQKQGAILRAMVQTNYRYYKLFAYEFSRAAYILDQFANHEKASLALPGWNLRSTFEALSLVLFLAYGRFIPNMFNTYLVRIDSLRELGHTTYKSIKYFMNKISRTQSQLQDAYYAQRPPGYVWWPRIPLRMKPFLRRNNGYVLANPFYLYDYLDTGLFRTLVRELEGNRSICGEIIGQVFEDYCHMLAVKSQKAETIIRLDSIKRSDRSRKIADLVIANGDTCLIVECKSGQSSYLDEHQAAYEYSVERLLVNKAHRVAEKFVNTEEELPDLLGHCLPENVLYVLLLPYEVPMFWLQPHYLKLKERISGRLDVKFNLDKLVPMSVWEWEAMLFSKQMFSDGLGLAGYLADRLDEEFAVMRATMNKETPPALAEYYGSGNLVENPLDSYLLECWDRWQEYSSG